jgi:hygromycin-B 4-O-kinase
LSKPLISLEQALQELVARWGEVEQFEQLTEGEESRAFGLRQAGQNYVLRINRSAEGFAKDDLAHRLFSSAGLPIPEILLIDMLDDVLALAISRRAPGETLQALKGAELSGAVGSVTDVLDVIQTTDISAIAGAGRLGSDAVATHRGWRAWVSDIEVPFHVPEVPVWVNQVKALAGALPEVRQLVHGDFGSNNVLVHQGRVSGIIDWSEALVGDGLYDIANILFWRPWLECMEQQARHIEKKRPDWLTDRQRLLCYQLRIGLQQLDEAAREDDAAMVQWIGARCREIAGDQT